MFTPHLRLGYQGPNRTLREQHVLTDRTARLSTVREKGVEYLEELYEKNLQDLLTILRWNVAQGILFYRASSALAPHVTNPKLLDLATKEHKAAKPAYMRLLYQLDTPTLRRVGRYVREQGIRLTFHPDPFLVLNAEREEVAEQARRELYYHYKLCKGMRLGPESVVILHGGGLYRKKGGARDWAAGEEDGPRATGSADNDENDDKDDNDEEVRRAGMVRWVERYLALPEKLRSRIVLENDERRYALADVLEMSRMAGAQSGGKVLLPVVLDVFHYACQDEYRRRRGQPEQPPIEECLGAVLTTWPATLTPKMHLSEQRPGGPLGAHSDYVRQIPAYMRTFYRRFHRDLDVMIEAKQGERAVLHLLGRKVDEQSGQSPNKNSNRSKKDGSEEAPENEDSVLVMGGVEEVPENEDSVLVLGSATFRKALDEYVPTRGPRGADDTARVVVAEGEACGRALALLARPPGAGAPRAVVLVEPTEHAAAPDNVIVHGKLPLGAERHYRHVRGTADVEEVAKSAARFL